MLHVLKHTGIKQLSHGRERCLFTLLIRTCLLSFFLFSMATLLQLGVHAMETNEKSYQNIKSKNIIILQKKKLDLISVFTIRLLT